MSLHCLDNWPSGDIHVNNNIKTVVNWGFYGGYGGCCSGMSGLGLWGYGFNNYDMYGYGGCWNRDCMKNKLAFTCGYEIGSYSEEIFNNLLKPIGKGIYNFFGNLFHRKS